MDDATRAVLSAAGGPVMIFDGDCALCAASVRFAAKRDRRRALRFLTIASPTGRAAAAAAGVDPDAPSTFLLFDDERLYAKSDAALRVGAVLKPPWPWLARVARIAPRFLRDGIYSTIARHRIAWFGRVDACWLDDLGVSERTLR